MIRINIPWIIEVVSAVDALDGLEAEKGIGENLFPLMTAQFRLEAVYSSVYSDFLLASRQKADELYREIKKHTENFAKNSESVITGYEVVAVQNIKHVFKTVFLAELATVPSFIVTAKAGYDINKLIEIGTVIFPGNLSEKVPEALTDAKEAAKALAFELPTSCGFHVFRVIESVLKRYWDEATGGKQRPKLETLGSYAKALEESGNGDVKIVESVKQIAKLHRNPLIHPEVILTVEESIGLIGIAHSVLAAMLSTLPNAPRTTGAPASQEPEV